MQLMLHPDISPLQDPIRYSHKLLLIGSCFTEHIAERLQQYKFKHLSNPHGILFNPLSVAQSLDSYVSGKMYSEKDLFFLNELWNSWDHHTRFSDVHKEKVLDKINSSQREASNFIRDADYIIVTLGSAFQYYLKEENRLVANNHRAPGQWFEKRLLPIQTITDTLCATVQNILFINSKVRFIFTISPVRHIRDGVVDNNRSKARLIEAIHELCASFEQCYYFPAYELVIDILRDYRFYDIDFVHPNYLATQFVWEQFVSSCIAAEEKDIMESVKDIVVARNHKVRFPETEAHKDFKARYKEKISLLIKQHSYLDLQEELDYFSA